MLENTDLKSLDKEQLSALLKDLKLYRDLEDAIGERWKTLYERIKNKKNTLIVEYFTEVSLDLAWENASVIYKKAFSIEPKREEVQFVEKPTLKWGIKVYLNDELVDMSFDKIEKSLRSA